MRGSWVSLLIVVSFGCDEASKTTPPGPPAPMAKVTTEAKGEGAPGGTAVAAAAAAPVDAGSAAPPGKTDPVASLFPVRYLPGETLPEVQQRRIKARLKNKTSVPIALHHIIDIAHPEGGRQVFALYEYSSYEDCVTRYPRAEARERCAGETIEEGGRQVRLNRACAMRGVVHAIIGPPAQPGQPGQPGQPSQPGQPGKKAADPDGALTITALDLPATLCEVGAYHRTLVADVDGDSKLEMYLDFTSNKEKAGDSRGQVMVEQRRFLYILSASRFATPQLALGFEVGIASGEKDAVELRDVDRDGRLDVLQTKPCLTHPEMPGDPDAPDPCGASVPRERIVFLYNPARDTYKGGVSSRVPARRLHDRAMKALAAKKPEAATQLWREAADLDPTWSWPPYNLACLASAQGRTDDALDQLQLLPSRNPDSDLLDRLSTDADLRAVRKLAAFDDVIDQVTKAIESNTKESETKEGESNTKEGESNTKEGESNTKESDGSQE